MGIAKVISEINRKLITVTYRASEYFNSDRYIHKYYLSPEDKGKLFPVDICALGTMAWHAVDFEVDGEINFWDGVVPDKLPGITIRYKDLALEKTVDSELVRRGLMAMAAYNKDLSPYDLSPEEICAAANFNEWLRGYEKKLAIKHTEIEEKMLDGLRGADPFLVDYEIDMDVSFYLRQDDPFCENEEYDRHDWDSDAALMCSTKYIMVPPSRKEFSNPDYFGIGDDRDHNDGHNAENPLCRFSHSYLFHELTSHRGIPARHLKRIGRIWTDITVRHQTAIDIDLTGEQLVANRVKA